jgi:hypothetical protein
MRDELELHRIRYEMKDLLQRRLCGDQTIREMMRYTDLCERESELLV